MLWMLVRPPDAGGLGMAYRDAAGLTLAEAELALASEKKIKAGCRAMNLASEGKTVADLKAEAREEILKRRQHYTGSRKLKK
jgi:hypothetical protein